MHHPRRDLLLCPRLDGRPSRNQAGAPVEGGRMRKGVPRENHRHHRRPAAPSRTDKEARPRRCCHHPGRDRLSRDTTVLLVIARHMQRAGAGIRSLAEPFLDTTSDFAEIIFTILGVAAKLERRRILERTARGRANAKEKGVKIRPQADLDPAPAERGPQAPRRGRDAAQRRPRLQCQAGDHFAVSSLTYICKERVKLAQTTIELHDFSC